MLTLLALLGVLVVVFLVAALATRDDQALAPAPPDAAHLELPSGRLAGPDLARVRFGLALRGYRMSEVDEVLERLGRELDARDEELAALRAGSGADLSAVPVDEQPGQSVPVDERPGQSVPVDAHPGQSVPVDARPGHPATAAAPARPGPVVPAEPPLETPPAPVVPPAGETSLQPPAQPGSPRAAADTASR